MRRVQGLSGALALLVGTLAGAPAYADSTDKISKRLVIMDGEAVDLENSVRAPSDDNKTDDAARRRLLDAQVAYGMGNYADASILLYDVVERFPKSPSWPDAVFFLADSLFMKGDSLTAREYFSKIVFEFGEGDPNYQKSIERLLELSLKLKDDTGVPDLLARLDRIPEGRRTDSAPYVRGKFAYFSNDLDKAISTFDTIPQSNKYYFQARYFLGAAWVAKGDLAQAVKVYGDLLKVQPTDDKQKRIVELAHMALGRLYYERDQPSEAIDQYLMVSRKSDLFDDALYEVAFVYVKSRQFDKALRALELLELATGGSCANNESRVQTVVIMPEICILKGNLGVRKAQQITEENKGNPTEEYGTALAIFENTRGAYQGPRRDLEKLIALHDDPKKYFAVITQQGGFDADVSIPDVAKTWIRQDPEVARVVNVTTDLDEIRRDLEETEQLIARLERLISSPNRVRIFPSLAEKRAKVYDMLEELAGMRDQLVGEERSLVARYASGDEKSQLDALEQKRLALAKELAALPNSGAKYEERVAKAKDAYQKLDADAKEIEVAISSLEAELIALEKYYADTNASGGTKLDPQVFATSVAEIKQMIADLRKELDELRQELVVAMDEAGIGDDLADEQRRLRKELDDVIRQEHTVMRSVSGRMSGGDAEKARTIGSLLSKLDQVDGVLQRINAKIDKILDAELAEIRVALAEEKAAVAEYKARLAEYETENVELGSEVIAGSFGTVSKKFYEITVRAEVGVIDVNWAEKEEAEGRFERIEKDSAREKRQLEGEFSEVSGDEEPAPAPATKAGEGGNAVP
jgi:tetratricopeptide (TPR) repeat protein